MKTFMNRLPILLFILMLFSVPVWWLSRGGSFNTTSIVEGRELALFPKLGYPEIKRTIWLAVRGRLADANAVFIDQIKDGTIQSQVEKASSDHFPLRLPLIRAAKAVDLGMIYSTYAFLPDEAIPTDSRSEIFITKDQSIVIKGLPLYKDETRRLIDERIVEYSRLADQYPEKKVYVFYFETLAYSEFDPRLPYFKDLDGGQSFTYFKAHIPQNIFLGEMDLSSVDEFNALFYHTDHHWNIRGAWKAYHEMYAMVAQNYPGISPVNDSMVFKTYPDLVCLGTYARDTLFPFSPEVFEIGEVNLAPYRVLERDSNIQYNKYEAYNRGIFEKDPYISHYAEYFGHNKEFLIYRFDNDATRNLLLIGTSYKIPLQPWIASHYNESYFVNLMDYPEFNLDKFLSQHQVDDIIILTNMDEISNPDLSLFP